MKGLIQKLLWEGRQNPAKVLQYFMLVFLFGIAFFLPAYGVRRQTQESAADNVRTVRMAEQSDLKDSEKESGGDARDSSKGTIVLDAGHGGFDSGMVGSSGISEKELNLVYAKKLEVLLTDAGYRVVQTRNTEEGLYDENQSSKKAQDMQRRCQIIAQEQPLMTISIHQNSFPADSSVCGPQVFYYEQSENGEKLAASIQEQLNAMPDVMRARTQKGNATYYILKHSASTTVIVECGFLTNSQEEAMLQEETYQNQIVKAIFDGILCYLNDNV